MHADLHLCIAAVDCVSGVSRRLSRDGGRMDRLRRWRHR